MHNQINWNVDSVKIEGIPEPKAPKGGGGQMPDSVSAIILAGFMKIINSFNENVLHPDQATVAKLKKLSEELNKLKGLLNELTQQNGSQLPKNWASQMKSVLGQIKQTIREIPPGSLKDQLQKALKAVSEFVNSPLKTQLADYIKDMQTFEKVWKKMLKLKHWEGSIETEFYKSLESLLADHQGFAAILKKLDPQAYPALYRVIKGAADQFNKFYNMLMSIEAGDLVDHHSLSTVWKGMHKWDHESLKNWMESLMHKEGALEDKPFGGHYVSLVVHKYDAFVNTHITEKVLEALSNLEHSHIPLEEVGRIIHYLAAHQTPPINSKNSSNAETLYQALSGLWDGFQNTVTATSQSISAAQSLNEKFVVQVNSALTEYKAIVQLATQEFLVPEQEVSMILSREQASALGG